MSKYIIRNCNVIYFNLDKTAICNDLNLECPCYCKERADCILKQIVDKCKEDLKPVREWQEGDTVFIEYKKDIRLASNVLQLLDIQECE